MAKKVNEFEVQTSADFVAPSKIPTGSLKLDYLIGGGVPKGRITCFYGAFSSGKTSLALSVVKQAQKSDDKRPVCFVDAERTYTDEYAVALGLDTSSDKIHLFEPACAEESYEFIQASLKDKTYSLIVLDSIPALQAKKELDGDIADQNIGLKSKLLGKHTMNVLYDIKKSDTAVIYLNQGRKDINTGKVTPFGGTAFGHNCSLILKMHQTSFKKQKEDVELDFSKMINVTVQKNKLGLKDLDCNIYYTDFEGIDYVIDIYTLAVHLGIIQKAGAWVKMGEDWKVNGAKKAVIELKDNPELFEIVEKKVIDILESKK